MTTGTRIKARRKELGLSAETIAAKLGVSPATIYRYERGDIEKIPGDKLPELARALQTTPNYLIGWYQPIHERQTTAQRLREIMDIRGLRQVDILVAAAPFCKKYNVKLGKNDLSQYVSGKVAPGQDKLTILGLALNVNEAWLMGYDVDVSRTYSSDFPITENCDISPAEKTLLSGFRELNKEGQSKVLSYTDDLIRAGIYKNQPEADPVSQEA